MTSYGLFALVFLLTLGGLWLGLRVARWLPSHHLVSEARQSAQIGIGMLATLLALVLGLMITSAKRSFDEREAGMVEVATSIVLLDRALVGFGNAAEPARSELRHLLESIVRVTARRAHAADEALPDSWKNLDAVTKLQQTILALAPGNETQRWYQARAMQLSTSLAQHRVLTAERTESSVPQALLVVVIGWVVLIYVGLGVFVVSNRSVITTLCICALAFACSIFIILELDTPYSGVVGISEKPLLKAGSALSQ